MLTGEDIELDDGGPLNIEHPKKIVTKPLSPKDQDDRIRMALGLTSNDPLPEADDETQEAYRSHLTATLVFPFEAIYTSESGPFSDTSISVKITALGHSNDEMYGVLCEARHEGRKVKLPVSELEVKKRNSNRQLIEDYSYWLWNYR